MENNNKKIKIKHRLLATICLALFCGAAFISHYQPIKTYADNDTDTAYRMPSGVNITYFYAAGIVFSYPLYAYNDVDNNNVMAGIGDFSTGVIDYFAVNGVQAPSSQSYAIIQSSAFARNPAFSMIELTISDFYCDKFNTSTTIPILLGIADDAAGNLLPLCDVFISYDVFNFDNGYYQTVSETFTDFNLNTDVILINKTFSLDYFPSAQMTNKMLHFKDITVLVVFDDVYDDGGFIINLELYRATNDAINTYNDLLYEHTWEEVEVSVNYLQSFYDTVSGFLAIELLPHFTIGTMLELAIAIPLVVWFLKSWLGG